ncbi:unnamed protein product [Toxocara canis]|uniref:Secreted protein n=1 Tax=Toxocara canis TaxID=6265 RepID=A0A183V1F6_TOXCA|nr:unnamed protein product [Toxocara canis]
MGILAMDVLLILKAVEFVFTFLVLMLLVLWPTHLCSQVSDVDLEAAYSNDAQCALEIQVGHSNADFVC